MSESEEKLSKEFSESFYEFMNEWNKNENLHAGIIIPILMDEIKIEACFFHDCYFHMLGSLTNELMFDLKQAFCEVKFEDYSESKIENDPEYKKEV